MPINIQERFQSISRVTQSLVIQFINRDESGVKKYGKTMDRQDLSPSDWAQHAIEELIDCVKYLQALKNSLSPDVIPPAERPDWGEPETPPSNANELSKEPLSNFLLQIFRNCNEKSIRQTLTEIFNAEPTLARIIGNAFASWESNQYLETPEKMPSDVMLRMVGSFPKDQQRDLLQKGLEVATGKRIKFHETPTPEKTK